MTILSLELNKRKCVLTEPVVPRSGPIEDPPSEEHHEQENPAAENNADTFNHVLLS